MRRARNSIERQGARDANNRRAYKKETVPNVFPDTTPSIAGIIKRYTVIGLSARDIESKRNVCAEKNVVAAESAPREREKEETTHQGNKAMSDLSNSKCDTGTHISWFVIETKTKTVALYSGNEKIILHIGPRQTLLNIVSHLLCRTMERAVRKQSISCQPERKSQYMHAIGGLI